MWLKCCFCSPEDNFQILESVWLQIFAGQKEGSFNGERPEDSPDFNTNHVAFVLDGVSFVHKYNAENVARQPKARVWRRKSEGLDFTAKGSKDLPGGRRLHLMVAAGFGKGVILRVAYEKMDGEFFANFIREHFNLCFGKARPKTDGKRLFVMSNKPDSFESIARCGM